MKIQNSFRDYTSESALFMKRTAISLGSIFLLTCVLIVNLYNLQIIHFDDYQTRSNENRIKLVPIAPSRGNIYDRNGIPLAMNRSIYQLEMIPEKMPNVQRILDELRDIVDLNDLDISNIKKKYVNLPRFFSIPIKTDLTEEQIARFSVNRYRFPGVKIRGYKRRYYPYGSVMTHVIGYVSKMNDKDIDKIGKTGRLTNYAATLNVGKLGIERYYENTLHGQIGYEEVETNSFGRVVRQLKRISPKAGSDIYLTIDLKIQQYIETLLTGSRAAVVATDPRTGDILALLSTPSYDPNLFVNGISRRNYNALVKDKNAPLVNRATQGVYPPASTVKPYVAISALSTGIITRNTSLFDPGWWKLPGSEKFYRDWKKCGHGYLNVTKSLEESSDTFFYKVAYDMGIDRLSKWMNKFGYGCRTGIDIDEEHSGNMPTKEWKLKRFKKPWYQGDTIPVGIGQGYWSATPLQMNKALMILINDGVVKVPHLMMNIVENGNKIESWIQSNKLKVDGICPTYWKIVRDGMYGVANRINGTAYKYFSSAPYKIAAKSGTAQIFSLKNNEIYNIHKIIERLRDHKLMIAYAPYDNPTIAVSIILENGGVGQDVGTIMRKILDYAILHVDDTKSKKEIFVEYNSR